MLNVNVTVAVTLLALSLGTALALRRQSPLSVTRSLCIGTSSSVAAYRCLACCSSPPSCCRCFYRKGVAIGRLLRAVAAMELFNAAYVAEAVRGSLQSVSAGHEEATACLGLRPW